MSGRFVHLAHLCDGVPAKSTAIDAIDPTLLPGEGHPPGIYDGTNVVRIVPVCSCHIQG